MEVLLFIFLKKYNMFYQCPKCKKTWNYPIKECPFCFENLIKIKSDEMIVIACSRVNIPTLLHPKIPYFVFIIEDENKNKYIFKSTKERKVGEKISYDSINNGVAIWRNKYNFEEPIEKTLKLINSSIKENSNILILPTLISSDHEYLRKNTSSGFLNAVLNIVLQKTKNIKIVGQSFNDTLIEFSVQKSGLLDICLKQGITPQDLSKKNFIKQNDLEISEEALNSDLIINLPIMKMEKNSATENIFKLLSKNNYFVLKYLYSEKLIAEKINKIMGGKILTIAEADVVQGPDKINRYLGIVLTSRDYLKLDKVFNALTMNKNIDDISIVGRSIEDVQHNIEKIC